MNEKAETVDISKEYVGHIMREILDKKDKTRTRKLSVRKVPHFHQCLTLFKHNPKDAETSFRYRRRNLDPLVYTMMTSLSWNSQGVIYIDYQTKDSF